VDDENWAVAVGAGADTDGGNAQLAGDLRGELAWHGFEDDGEGACGFDGTRVAQQLFRRVGGFALHAVAAERIHGLRRQADVAHYWNFGLGQARDELEAAFAAFDLDGLDAGFLYEAHGVAQRFRGVRVIAAERHIRDHQRMLGAAPHRSRV